MRREVHCTVLQREAPHDAMMTCCALFFYFAPVYPNLEHRQLRRARIAAKTVVRSRQRSLDYTLCTGTAVKVSTPASHHRVGGFVFEESPPYRPVPPSPPLLPRTCCCVFTTRQERLSASTFAPVRAVVKTPLRLLTLHCLPTPALLMHRRLLRCPFHPPMNCSVRSPPIP